MGFRIISLLKNKIIVFILIILVLYTAAVIIKNSMDDFQNGIKAINKGDYDEALLKLEKYAEENPDGYPVDLLLGNIAYHKGDKRKAIEQYEKALESSKNPFTMTSLGLLHFDYEEYNTAISYFASSLDYGLSNSIPYINHLFIGWCNYYLGNTEEAENNFNNAIEYNPDISSAYIGLSKIYEDADEIKSKEFLNIAKTLDTYSFYDYMFSDDESIEITEEKILVKDPRIMKIE